MGDVQKCRPRRPGGDGRDRGQSAVMLLIVVAVMGGALAAALADFGSAVGERARAQTAADAAALASLDGGRSAASRLAAVNGGAVVAWARGPGTDQVTVTVQVGDSTATARASDAP